MSFYFRLKLIAARTLLTAAAFLVATAGVSANDFSLVNNQFSISDDGELIVNATLGFDGVLVPDGDTLPSIDLDDETLASGIPSFSFTIDSTGLTANTTHSFRVGLSIEDDADPTGRRFEAYINTLTLAIDGSKNVLGTIPSQDMFVRAKKGSATFYQAINNPGDNGPFTISGGTLTFSGTRAVSLLKAQGNDILDAVLDNFTLNGVFTFRVVVEETTSGGARVGTRSGVAFTPVPRIATACEQDSASTVGNVFQLFADTGFSNPYVVQGRFASGTGDTTKTSPDAFTDTENCLPDVEPPASGGTTENLEQASSELVSALEGEVTEENLEALDSANDSLQVLSDQLNGQLQAELEAGALTEETVVSVINLAEQTATTTQLLLTALENEVPVTADTLLTALTTASGSAETGSTVVDATTDEAAKAALIGDNNSLLEGSGALLEALADSGETLTDDQVAAVRDSVTQLARTAESLGEAENVEELDALVAATNRIIEAQEALGVPADSAQLTQLREAAEAIGSKALLNASGDQIEEALDKGLKVPSSQPDDTDERLLTLESNGFAFPTSVSPRDLLVEGTAVVRSTDLPDTTFPSIFRTALDLNVNTNSFLSKVSALQKAVAQPSESLALNDGELVITEDEITGLLSVSLAGETFLVSGLDIRFVASATPNGLSFRDDGRATLISDGIAVQLAPAPFSSLDFIVAVESAGFSYSAAATGSFSADLGGGSTFVGAFAFDNVAGADLTAECGDLSVAAPIGAVNSATYAYSVDCSNGVSQRVVPFLADAGFLKSIRDVGLSVSTDRNTGVLSVGGGVGQFKPSFVAAAPNAEELAFLATFADARGFAAQAVDVNSDGVTDYKIISSSNVQILYGVEP